MSFIEITLFVTVALLIVILVLLLQQKRGGQRLHEFQKTNLLIEKIDPLIRLEFAGNREEIQKGARATREEVAGLFKNFGDGMAQSLLTFSAAQKEQFETFSAQLNSLIKFTDEKMEKLISTIGENQKEFKTEVANSNTQVMEQLIKSLASNEEKTNLLITKFEESTRLLNQQLNDSGKQNRTELMQSLKSFEDKFTANVKDFNELQRQKFSDLLARHGEMKTETSDKLEKVRETVESKLHSLQAENSKKLEEMRTTVDEKLQSTLEKRFNESFTVISERLEQVHKGLGEMQSLATNVGDLKRVMSNVKSRGVLGEYQLANILEDLLTNEQYEKNVRTKAGSGAIVEFAIRMPNGNNLEKSLWLPIDSKFPKEDYEALMNAYEAGEADKIDDLRRSFRNSIVKNAKDIKERYIDPPNTTEYGIMFLPFESLYAEVLRTPGLFESLQKEHKITVTGPTTLSALLNSLQMGFRTLAIEKRSSEVWDVLSVVKKEFGNFGLILEKTKKKLQEATNTIDQASTRSRVIDRKLRKVQELPSSENITKIENEIRQSIVDEGRLSDVELGEDDEGKD